MKRKTIQTFILMMFTIALCQVCENGNTVEQASIEENIAMETSVIPEDVISVASYEETEYSVTVTAGVQAAIGEMSSYDMATKARSIGIETNEFMMVGNGLEEESQYEIRDVYPIENGNTTKTILPYKAFGKKTNQAKLQSLCTTNEVGLRVYNDGNGDRYCVAVGTYFDTIIGQYFDLILENGVIIPCVMGDEKADEHTDENGLFTVHSGCMTEFVVETKYLPHKYSATYCYDDWKSKVVTVIVYNEFVDLSEIQVPVEY